MSINGKIKKLVLDGNEYDVSDPPEEVLNMTFCNKMPLVVRWMKLKNFLKLCDEKMKKSINKMVDSMSEFSGIDVEKLDIVINKTGTEICGISLYLNPHLKKEIYTGSAEVLRW